MDFVIKLVAAAAFIAYLTVLGIYVPEPSLLTVLVIAGVMAVYDFFFFRQRPRDRA